MKSNKTMISLLRFQPGDQDDVKTLILEGMRQHWGTLDPSLNPDLNDIAVTYVKALFLVARQEGRVVACGALVPREEGEAEVVRMSVASDMRRQGLGRMILQCLLEHARQTGVRRVVLETTSTWSEVVDFYLQNGFHITHEKDGDTYFLMEI